MFAGFANQISSAVEAEIFAALKNSLEWEWYQHCIK